MKKIVFVSLLLLAALSCSCSGDDGGASKNDALKEKTPVVQPEDVHAGGASALAPQDVVPPAPDEMAALGEKTAPAAPEAPSAQPLQTVQTAGSPPVPPVPEKTPIAPAAQAPTGDLANARQLVLVVAGDWKASRAGLARYERETTGSPWKRVGEPEACALGRNGLGWGKGLAPNPDKGPQKREGDGKTPAGVFSLPGAFGSLAAQDAAAMGVALPFTRITPGLVCVTDPASASFNRLTDKSAADVSRYDRMNRDSGVNALGAVIGHNLTDPAPKAGSCVFLNISEGQGKATGGSVGCPASAVKNILTWLDPRKNPVIVILPQEEYATLRPALGLP